MIVVALGLWPRGNVGAVADRAVTPLAVAIRDGGGVYLGDDSARGLEVELLEQYADEQQRPLRWLKAANTTALAALIEDPEVEVVAGSVSARSLAAPIGAWSEPLFEAQPVVIHRRALPLPERLDGAASALVLVGSSLDPALIAHYGLAPHHGSARSLLDTLNEGRASFAVLDEHLYLRYRRLYPALTVGPTLGPPVAVRIGFAGRHATSLKAGFDRFLARLQHNGAHAELMARYAPQGRLLDGYQIERFVVDLDRRLPRWKTLFEQAAAANGLDWRVLAAVGYQESGWQADAVSPTGVRGLMMLTLDTARTYGVRDRRDPKQSVHGGARVLRDLLADQPAHIDYPDRLWFALAAYNLGPRHLVKAQTLTAAHGDDPERWSDVAAHLPKLSQRQWQRKLRTGRANGIQAAEFVASVSAYLHALEAYTREPVAELRGPREVSEPVAVLRPQQPVPEPVAARLVPPTPFLQSSLER